MFELTEENFEKTVLHAQLPVIVEFGAEWCQPCKRLEPELEKLATLWDGKVVLAHVNVDQDPDLAMQYQVMGVPTVILVKNGEVVERFSGFRSLQKITESFEDHVS
ncbi:MAG: thioredoxin [Chloroflexi bacterium HGW-Chloroflexi-10]|nr:MAG: thioredoxin [Chloroflexi bacterium HGW-Chloroflexi-10]